MKIRRCRREGQFIEKYNYGNGIVGFDEYVLRSVSSCTLGCAYCYLQDIYNTDEIILYDNFSDLKNEILALRNRIKGLFYLNNGENADSLLFEPAFGMTRRLIEIFRGLPDSCLELRTKTSNVDHLLGINHGGNIIVAFSLNPPGYIKKFEPNSAGIDERINAIKKCAAAGYKIGLRFEPLIHLDDWREKYLELLEHVTGEINPDCIDSIGIGALRLTGSLYEKMAKKNISSEILAGEFVPCCDKKLRYFRETRTGMYACLIEYLMKKYRNTFKVKPYLPAAEKTIFLSNEPHFIWEEILGLLKQ